MMPKKIVILGSTGSIGRSTFEVVRHHHESFRVVGLAAHSNYALLLQQYHILKPDYLCLVDTAKQREFEENLKGERVNLLFGEEGLVELAQLAETELVVNAIVGFAGLKASLAAVQMGKNLALANKESLVSGGPLFPPLIETTKAAILPIDSEHSAIWQALACGKPEEMKKIIITASGGPFRTWPKEKFASITKEQALNHPTWKMGRKITIDCATLVNKGLEVMEAVILFSLRADQVEIVIHPQSVIHSMVEFRDSSVIAQMSMPDMRLPITYALFWPKRADSPFGAVNFHELSSLTFEPPDYDRFPALKLAFEAARVGQTAPAVFNAANEVAVAAFLNDAIKFTDITDIIDETLSRISAVANPRLDDILEADSSARQLAEKRIGQLACY